MKNIFVFIAVLFIAMLTFSACNNDKTNTIEEATEENATTQTGMDSTITYTCTMHPEVKSDKPGSCPTCGMTLVKAENDGHNHSDSTMHKN